MLGSVATRARQRPREAETAREKLAIRNLNTPTAECSLLFRLFRLIFPIKKKPGNSVFLQPTQPRPPPPPLHLQVGATPHQPSAQGFPLMMSSRCSSLYRLGVLLPAVGLVFTIKSILQLSHFQLLFRRVLLSFRVWFGQGTMKKIHLSQPFGTFHGQISVTEWEDECVRRKRRLETADSINLLESEVGMLVSWLRTRSYFKMNGTGLIVGFSRLTVFTSCQFLVVGQSSREKEAEKGVQLFPLVLAVASGRPQHRCCTCCTSQQTLNPGVGGFFSEVLPHTRVSSLFSWSLFFFFAVSRHQGRHPNSCRSNRFVSRLADCSRQHRLVDWLFTPLLRCKEREGFYVSCYDFPDI